mgnify:CR=1 FL=1
MVSNCIGSFGKGTCGNDCGAHLGKISQVKADGNGLPGRNRQEDGIAAETVMPITVLAATPPKQTIQVTEWFYCDCLATYYRVPVCSAQEVDSV